MKELHTTYFLFGWRAWTLFISARSVSAREWLSRCVQCNTYPRMSLMQRRLQSPFDKTSWFQKVSNRSWEKNARIDQDRWSTDQRALLTNRILSRDLVVLVSKGSLRIGFISQLAFRLRGRGYRAKKNFRGWHFQVRTFQTFSKVKLPKVKLPKVQLPKVKLSKVKLSKVKISKVKLSKVELSKVELSKVDFQQSNFQSWTSRLKLPNFQKLNFHKFNFQKFNFRKLHLRKLHLRQ